VLGLTNMHGDIIATCTDDPTTTGPLGYTESTEYGAPRNPTTAPDTYGWLGTKQRSTNDLAGLTLMGVRLYNPTTGRFLSIDPVPGGNDNPYIYVTNPTDQTDLDGNCWHWCRSIWHAVHKYTVDVVATAPYGAYAAAYGLRRTSWGRNRRWLRTVEHWGIHADMAIDRYKIRHHLGERSAYDEGPGSIVYFNPFHTLTRRFGFAGPAWHNAPGAWRDHAGRQRIDY